MHIISQEKVIAEGQMLFPLVTPIIIWISAAVSWNWKVSNRHDRGLRVPYFSHEGVKGASFSCSYG